MNDATWLADLMAHGLIRASFVPGEPTQQMRDLLRTRKQFVRERSTHTQRIQKTLEDANIKLDAVITDIVGLSGRRMIAALTSLRGWCAYRRLSRLAVLEWVTTGNYPGSNLAITSGLDRTSAGAFPRLIPAEYVVFSDHRASQWR